MDRNTEKRIARNFLRYHHVGYSVVDFFMQHWLRYMLHILLMISAFSAVFLFEDALVKILYVFVTAMLFGAFLRDLGWVIRIKKNWPFNEKVLDWDKIEEIASDQEGE